MSQLFIEKYRPKLREDIVGNKVELDRLFQIASTGTIPNCIYEGSPGTGKTTTAIAIARKLFGEFYKFNWREFNASDDRGIGIVRDEIKDFCKTSPMGSTFKILFLDEADGLTKDAQEALRRMMEQYSNITRFILSCNDISKIIEPLQSRCETFHFAPLSAQDIASKIRQVSSLESIVIDEEAISFLSVKAEGDMRKALNKLQVLASYGCSIDKNVVGNYNKEHDIFSPIITSLKTGRFLESRTLCTNLLIEGYSERDIIQELHKSIIQNTELTPQIKGEVIATLAETDYRLTLGVSKGLQTDACLLKLLKILKVN